MDYSQSVQTTHSHRSIFQTSDDSAASSQKKSTVQSVSRGRFRYQEGVKKSLVWVQQTGTSVESVHCFHHLPCLWARTPIPLSALLFWRRSSAICVHPTHTQVVAAYSMMRLDWRYCHRLWLCHPKTLNTAEKKGAWVQGEDKVRRRIKEEGKRRKWEGGEDEGEEGNEGEKWSGKRIMQLC